MVGGKRRVQDFIGIADLHYKDLIALLDLADSMGEILRRPIKKVPTLRGKAVANLFFEASTRTRNSFELAGKYLSADVVNFQGGGSSVEKGESLVDTVKTFEALAVDALVIRHHESGVPRQLAAQLNIPVINAGDGMHEHPTQGLLDLLTVRQRFGHIDGLCVAIVGDVLHSRVARSDLYGFLAMGARVMLVGPPNLLPTGFDELGVEVTSDVSEAIACADVIQVLRVQRERLAAGELPSLEEYRQRWGMTAERLANARREIVIMHPGPQNRGVEIDSDVMERSAILQQVQNGVAVRMAVLYRLLGEESA